MVEAYVMVNTAAETSPSVIQQIRKIEGVKRANIVAGDCDVIATVAVGSPQELLMLVTDEIQSIEGVGHTRTNIILD